MSSSKHLGIYLSEKVLELGIVEDFTQCLEVISTEIVPSKPVKAQILEAISHLKNDFEAIGLILPREYIFPQVTDSLAEILKVPVSQGYFGTASALYEARFGVMKHEKNFIALTLGQDVDAGIWVDGKITIGTDGLAGDFSNMLVNAFGKLYPVGNYMSHQGVVDTVTRLLANAYSPSPLRDISYNELSPQIIIDEALKHEEVSNAAIDELGRILGLKMSDITNYFSPKKFVLSSDLPHFARLIRRSAGKHMQKNLFPIFKGKISVELSELPTDMEKVVKAVALIENV